jgi:hypothetical protein
LPAAILLAHLLLDVPIANELTKLCDTWVYVGCRMRGFRSGRFGSVAGDGSEAGRDDQCQHHGTHPTADFQSPENALEMPSLAHWIYDLNGQVWRESASSLSALHAPSTPHAKRVTSL